MFSNQHSCVYLHLVVDAPLASEDAKANDSVNHVVESLTTEVPLAIMVLGVNTKVVGLVNHVHFPSKCHMKVNTKPH